MPADKRLKELCNAAGKSLKELNAGIREYKALMGEAEEGAARNRESLRTFVEKVTSIRPGDL